MGEARLAQPPPSPYLAGMKVFSRFNPAGGIADFWNEIRRPTPYRWPVLGASMLCTGSLLFWLTGENYWVAPEPPEVSFISTFEAGRTDAEIIASNRANQIRQDRLAAEQAQRDEEVKEMYRALGRATGLNVDAMERRIEAERAAENAAKAAAAGTNAAAR